MQKLISFSAFLFQYIESFLFLEVAKRGDFRPSNPLNLPLLTLPGLHIISKTQLTRNGAAGGS